MKKKKTVYLLPEKRYGKEGFDTHHTYMSHAYGSYSTGGWIFKDDLNKLFPKERYEHKIVDKKRWF